KIIKAEVPLSEMFGYSTVLRSATQGRATYTMDELVRHFGFGAINWVATWYRPGGKRTPADIADTFWSFLAYGLIHEPARPKDLDVHFAKLLATTFQEER
ncbi:MAG: hypothetical protein ACO1OB_11130, partial [Archangium sp.]